MSHFLTVPAPGGRSRALFSFHMRDVLDYYLHDGPTEFRIKLVGTINDEAARRLEQVWRTAGSLIGDRRPTVDITFVKSVDGQGSALLLGWHQAGALMLAS